MTKTRPATPHDARPVDLPSAARVPSSFPTESMPVGATHFDAAKASRLAALLVEPDSEAAFVRALYLSERPERRTVYDGPDDCDEQEQNGK